MLRMFGGNQVRTLELSNGYTPFAEDPYRYGAIHLDADTVWSGVVPGSCTLFVVTSDPGALFEVTPSGTSLSLRDALQMEGGGQVTIRAVGGAGNILLGGVTQSQIENSTTLTPGPKQYKVSKPWGHEIWINGEHPGYCLKEVYLKAGTRTSLQYHNLKRETNVLLFGRIRLIYKTNEAVALDDTRAEDLGFVELEPTSAIDVTPGVLHRIEAMTDSTLYEVSTPHLDDVIRVSDDAARQHGRITGEHVQ